MIIPVIDIIKTGENIKRIMSEKGITPLRMTELMTIGKEQSVYKWQRGEALPTIDHLVELALILDVPLEAILILKNEEIWPRWLEWREND